MDKQMELDALTDRYEQYRRRAELALEKAESNVHVHDAEAEEALKEELAKFKTKSIKMLLVSRYERLMGYGKFKEVIEKKA